ncbi:MAG: SDR family NAD(P)-dependent oxidoreductase [Actinomycetota bacterium]
MAERVAVVTGAGSGIGQACAQRLAEDGCQVAALDLDEAGLAETTARIEEAGHRCMAVTVDLLDRLALETAFATVRDQLGLISILHSNAGGTGGVASRTFAKSSYEQWDRYIALNLTQNIDCARQVVPAMIEQGWGRLIVTSSEMAFRANWAMSDYAAAKAGLLGWVRNVAHELGKYGVTVNAVCPGATRTPLVESMPEEHRAKTLTEIPLGRLGEPDEIAHTVSFLASEGASYVTGESILVAGGRTLH